MESEEKAYFLAEGNVFIGQKYAFEPTVDAAFVIERILEEAYEEGSEYVQDYLGPPPRKNIEARQTWNAQIADLEKRLTAAFREWAKETKNEPRFHLIFDIRTEAIAKDGAGDG
jgi:hypothetical protein